MVLPHFFPGRSVRDASNTEGNLHRQGDDTGGVGDGLSWNWKPTSSVWVW